jgi:ribosomal protein L37E
MAFTDKQKNAILGNLRSKIRGSCPMCGQGNWNMQDELVACVTTSLQGGMAMGGPMVPTIQVICTHCGFVSFHAVGALGVNLNP